MTKTRFKKHRTRKARDRLLTDSFGTALTGEACVDLRHQTWVSVPDRTPLPLSRTHPEGCEQKKHRRFKTPQQKMDTTQTRRLGKKHRQAMPREANQVGILTQQIVDTAKQHHSTQEKNIGATQRHERVAQTEDTGGEAE